MKEDIIEQIKPSFYHEKTALNIKSYQENEELIDLYYQYTEELVDLFDSLFKNNSDLFNTIVFDFLVQKGFFSATHQFDFDKDNFQELLVKPGISIVNGEGACRNIACFYEDVFTCFYKYPLKICCYDPTFETNQMTQATGNHVINITKHNDTIYGFDLLNHCLFVFTNKEDLNGFLFDHPLKYTYLGNALIRIITNVDYQRNIKEEIENERKIFEEAYKGKIISEYEYKKLIIKGRNFISENEHILQSFMFKNNSLTKDIKKKMLSLK